MAASQGEAQKCKSCGGWRAVYAGRRQGHGGGGGIGGARMSGGARAKEGDWGRECPRARAQCRRGAWGLASTSRHHRLQQSNGLISLQAGLISEWAESLRCWIAMSGPSCLLKEKQIHFGFYRFHRMLVDSKHCVSYTPIRCTTPSASK
jgi:hypothetical protein